MLVPHPRGFDTELVRQQREAWGFGQEEGGEKEEDTEAKAKEEASTSWQGGRHEWNVVEGIVALEVLQWLLADPDLKEHLGRATLASAQHPDQLRKRGHASRIGSEVLVFWSSLCLGNCVLQRRNFAARFLGAHVCVEPGLPPQE